MGRREMKDRYYKANTKSTFKSVKLWLTKLGYKEMWYGDAEWNETSKIGEAWYEKPGVSLTLKYEWVKNPNGNGYVSGKMISLEDMTSCYSKVMGKETGYR